MQIAEASRRVRACVLFLRGSSGNDVLGNVAFILLNAKVGKEGKAKWKKTAGQRGEARGGGKEKTFLHLITA